MLIHLIVVNLTQYICVVSHHIIHLKTYTVLYVNKSGGGFFFPFLVINFKKSLLTRLIER